MSNLLYIGNIPYRASAKELEAHFASAGGVVKVDRLTERDKGRNRGFAFIQMESEDYAECAVKQLNGAEFQGRNLRVVIARPDDE